MLKVKMAEPVSLKLVLIDVSRRRNDSDHTGSPKVRHAKIYVRLLETHQSEMPIPLPADLGEHRNKYYRPVVLEALERLGLVTRFKWSWYAGDPNSKLSPGFITDAKWDFDLYITAQFVAPEKEDDIVNTVVGSPSLSEDENEDEDVDEDD